MRKLVVATLVLSAAMLAAAAARAQVKPGDSIGASNASMVKDLVSPGTYVAVSKGMRMNIVAPQRVDWPPPYQDATEKYSGQVRLSEDHRTVVGYVAGQPFPLLDPNDPYVATKIMWDSSFRPIGTDDADLRFFDCEVAPQNPGGKQNVLNYTQLGHLAAYSSIGRTEVEPLPIDPDFKQSGIWWQAGVYPVISPAEGKGSGGIRFRYWDPNRADDTWAYLSQSRRVRRINEVTLSSSPGLTTWDSDHAGGFNAKPQEYNYKFLGERQMLACAHAAHSPEQVCDSDGGATACPDDWEMRRQWMVEVTPRPERIQGILQSKTIVYVDAEMWFSPYMDSYDQRGELWKTQIYLMTVRDRPVPEAKVAIYPFKRQFNLAAASIDLQTGVSTSCYLPGRETPERECWYINMGAVNKTFISTDAMVKAGH
jgi:hypothetical protein